MKSYFRQGLRRAWPQERMGEREWRKIGGGVWMLAYCKVSNHMLREELEYVVNSLQGLLCI